MMCWWLKNEMECEWRLNQSESSSKVSVRRGDSLGRIGIIGLKEKIGFLLFVELRGRQCEERVVGLSRWCWRKSSRCWGSEAISQTFIPHPDIFDTLLSFHHCSSNDLYPYQFRLGTVRNFRVSYTPARWIRVKVKQRLSLRDAAA